MSRVWLLPVVALAALSVVAPAVHPGGGSVVRSQAATSPPLLVLRGGTALWQLTPADFDTSAAKLHRRKPCLRMRIVGPDVQLCLVKRRVVRVEHGTDRAYRLRASRSKVDGRVSLSLRTADLMLPPGTAKLVQTCDKPKCDPPRYGRSLTVPKLRLTSCRASAPWYVSASTGRGRTVALTFDDGPWTHTNTLLRTLRQLHVPATFFVVGSNGDHRRRELRRIVRKGHQLANHTWSHADLTHRSDALARRELRMTDQLIRNVTGQRTCAFRAPYAAESGRVIDIARGEGLVTINWNVDPRDWTGPSSWVIADRVLAAVRPGSIVVLHDAAYGARTAAALPRIVNTLRARGYRFLTVAELLDLKPRYEQRAAAG